jgi:hypothetical protein
MTAEHDRQRDIAAEGQRAEYERVTREMHESARAAATSRPKRFAMRLDVALELLRDPQQASFIAVRNAGNKAADTIDTLTAALERCAEARMPGEARRNAREALELVKGKG